MAQQIPPVRILNLGGVFTAGNALRRPADTALICHNFRPMPGGGLRLRAGLILKRQAVDGTIQFVQFFETEKGSLSSGRLHIAQTKDTTPDLATMWAIDLSSNPYTLTTIDNLPTVDGTPRAICNVRDRAVYDNASGTRTGVVSIPPLSSWDGVRLRYMGLDVYYPSGLLPNVSLTATPGYNTVVAGMTVAVGLYNSGTGHFSNGLVLGRISGGPLGTITFTNLDRIAYTGHDAAEIAELYYVFYASGDGLAVPYLVLNSTGTDIYKVPVGTVTANISLTNLDPKGFYFSPAHEMPTTNFAPRPMEDLCYANGRLYGILRSGGSGAANKYDAFTYVVPERDAAAVVFSASASDLASQETAFVGVPEESWPLTNKKYAPNGERPKKVSDLPNRNQVLVITTSGTFYMEEVIRGLHSFEAIDEKRGIGDKRTFCKTPYGPMWVTQYNEIVLLDPVSLRLQVVSNDYADLLEHFGFYPTDGVPIQWVASDYILQPTSGVDRYMVCANDGYFVCHDFAIARDQQRRGVTVAPGWSGNYQGVNTMRTMRDASGGVHHLVAKWDIWTQEADAQVRKETTCDQMPGSPSFLIEVVGEWVSQWLDFGDPRVRKEARELHVIGDAFSSANPNTSPLAVKWFADLAGTEYVVTLRKDNQSTTNLAYTAKLGNGNRFWFKFRLTLSGHAIADGGPFEYPTAPSVAGELNMAALTYGVIAEVAVTVNPEGQNR
jgi:hypothetical protein